MVFLCQLHGIVPVGRWDRCDLSIGDSSIDFKCDATVQTDVPLAQGLPQVRAQPAHDMQTVVPTWKRDRYAILVHSIRLLTSCLAFLSFGSLCQCASSWPAHLTDSPSQADQMFQRLNDLVSKECNW